MREQPLSGGAFVLPETASRLRGSLFGGGARSLLLSGGGFSPLDLNPDLYFSPKDADTRFQDIEGRSAAGADDPVRLLLDKSSRLARGPELWTPETVSLGVGWSGSAGVYTKESTGNATLGPTNLAPFQWFEVQFTLAASQGVLNLWRTNDTNTGNQQVAGNNGTGTHRVIARSGPATNGQGSHLWFDGTNFIGTIENVSFRPLYGNHATAPADADRPLFRAGGAPHLESDGISDTLRVDMPVSGPMTLWMAGDFSAIGTDRFLSFGGDSGADWNTAGHIAFEGDAGGFLKIVRDEQGRPLSAGYPPFILLEIDTDGHRSYGPMGTDLSEAMPPTNAARVGLFASANTTPTANGRVKVSEFGLVKRLLSSAERARMLSYLGNVGLPS